MRLSVQYTYEAHKETRRNFLKVRVRDRIEVDVREVAAEAAPIAYRSVADPAKSPALVEVRRVGGGLCEPVATLTFDGAPDGEWVPIDPTNSTAVATALTSSAGCLNPAFAWNAVDKEPKSSYQTSDKADSRRRIGALFDSLVLVDGVLFKPCREPVLGFDEHGEPCARDTHYPDGKIAFRIDEGAAFVEVATATGGREAGEKAGALVARFRDVAPSLLTLDLRNVRLYQAAKGLLAAVAKRAHRHPVPLLMAYDDLRGVLPSPFRSEGVESRADAIATATHACIEQALLFQRTELDQKAIAVASTVVAMHGRDAELAPDDDLEGLAF